MLAPVGALRGVHVRGKIRWYERAHQRRVGRATERRYWGELTRAAGGPLISEPSSAERRLLERKLTRRQTGFCPGLARNDTTDRLMAGI